MKTPIILIALLGFFISTTTQAQNTAATEGSRIIIHLSQTAPDILNVTVANLQNHRTKIAITDLHGKTWFSDYVKKENGFARSLDISQLPEGNFLFYVQQKGAAATRVFSFRDQLVQESSTVQPDGPVVQLTADSKPAGQLITYVTAENPNAVGLQLANLQGSEARLQLNTLQGIPAWEGSISGESGYAKRLNLTGMDSGIYYLVLATAGQTEVCFLQKRNMNITILDRQLIAETRIDQDLAGK